MPEYWVVCLIFMIIATIYSSVGFGGGSSYLAVLSLFSFPYKELRMIALICNVIVVLGGLFIYMKNNQVDWKKSIPLVIFSVPLAYLGAVMKVSQNTFFIILGISLIVASFLLWIKTSNLSSSETPKNALSGTLSNSLIGGAIGFLSGMVGIGGGIFLSPILNLMKWDLAKKIAATASMFILVNSIAGLAGQLSNPPRNIDINLLIMVCLSVFLGGQIGSRISIKFNSLIVKRMSALLVLYAGIQVLWKHLF